MMPSAKAVWCVTVCLIWSAAQRPPEQAAPFGGARFVAQPLHRPVIAFGVGHQQIDLPAVGENDELIRIAVIEAGEYRGRFHRLGRRQRQILQLAAVEFGVVAVVNGDVRLPGARQQDDMLAAFGRRFFHSLVAQLAVAPADGLWRHRRRFLSTRYECWNRYFPSASPRNEMGQARTPVPFAKLQEGHAVRMASDLSPEMAACAAARRAIGTR